MATVRQQIDGNSYKSTLLKALGAGLVALIALSQLGSAARFGSGGPRLLLPASISAVIVAATLLGLAYGNYSYASAQLNSRLALKTVTETDGVPADITRSGTAGHQMTCGVIAGLVAVAFYVASIWWPK